MVYYEPGDDIPSRESGVGVRIRLNRCPIVVRALRENKIPQYFILNGRKLSYNYNSCCNENEKTER